MSYTFPSGQTSGKGTGVRAKAKKRFRSARAKRVAATIKQIRLDRNEAIRDADHVHSTVASTNEPGITVLAAPYARDSASAATTPDHVPLRSLTNAAPFIQDPPPHAGEVEVGVGLKSPMGPTRIHPSQQVPVQNPTKIDPHTSFIQSQGTTHSWIGCGETASIIATIAY